MAGPAMAVLYGLVFGGIAVVGLLIFREGLPNEWRMRPLSTFVGFAVGGPFVSQPAGTYLFGETGFEWYALGFAPWLLLALVVLVDYILTSLFAERSSLRIRPIRPKRS